MAGKKMRVQHLLQMKKEGRKIVAVTAYDYPTARVVEKAGVDLVLVGDSVGNTVMGYDSTIPVQMEDMIYHCAAVTRGIERPLVVGDMPFMSYKVSIEQALENAGRFIQDGGAAAVKVEGGEEIAPAIEALILAGIPVLGHLGLTPQSVHALSGYRIQGRDEAAAGLLEKDAKLLQELGCFGIVLELMAAEVADHVSKQLQIPTIGIGAGAGCDGQILILHDVIGFGEKPAPFKFVKEYARVFDVAREAVEQYADEVRSGKYPGEEHSHH